MLCALCAGRAFALTLRHAVQPTPKSPSCVQDVQCTSARASSQRRQNNFSLLYAPPQRNQGDVKVLPKRRRCFTGGPISHTCT
eukprot:277240-Chlamydomonas_euryale.AAC.9